jgi:predicted Fe-Mo cluster-binding NifX family protein
VLLSLDELEAIRLADLQGLSQTAAAQQMGVSRQTFGRVVSAARAKVARALVQSKAIRIEESGPVEIAQPSHAGNVHRVAIALSPRGQVSKHFGKAARFVVYSVSDGKRIGEEIRDNPKARAAIASAEPPRDRPDGPRGPCHVRDRGSPGCRSGHQSWVLEAFGDCAAVITAGIGAGAISALRSAGIRPVVLDHPTEPLQALKLYLEGRV